LLHLNPAFVQGVSVQFALDLAVKWLMSEPPWVFCARVIQGWHVVKGEFDAIHRYYVGHRGLRPPGHLVSDLRMYGTDAQVIYALGEAEYKRQLPLWKDASADIPVLSALAEQTPEEVAADAADKVKAEVEGKYEARMAEARVRGDAALRARGL
jgi:hypothetical protein